MSASSSSACDDCLRRSWLVARLAGHLETARCSGIRLPEVLALDDDDLIAALARGDAGAVRRGRDGFDARAARRRMEGAGVSAVCAHGSGWPARLRGIRDAPAALHVLGDPGRLAALAPDEPAVALVGTRRASAYGLEVARALGRDLAVAGVAVVSGMALGVDAAAQTGALEGGGLTVAVLAGSADIAYPASKRALHARIAREGLVVSEMPPGVRARRWSFPARNRIIAALGELTVVVEAAERSGSLITADLASRLGREVAAVPGRVTAPQAAGANALLRDGALLVRDARDVLDALFGAGAPRPAPAAAPAGLTPPLVELLAAVAAGADTAGALGAGSAEGARSALAALGRLELLGLVRRTAGGRYEVAASGARALVDASRPLASAAT